MGAGKAYSTAEYAKVAQRNSAVEGGAQTLSPSMPAMHSGKGVLWATAKSSTTWLGVVFEGLETQVNKLRFWLIVVCIAFDEQASSHSS